MKEDLQKEGIPEEALSKLKAHIGLDIRAEILEKIAISIAAEIVAVKKGRFAQTKKGE